MNAVRYLRSVACFALLALAVGAAEVHGSAADHWSNRGVGAVSRVAAANHPFDAHHFEAATLQDHPPCPACLLQAQTVAVGLAAPGVQPVLARQDGPAGPPVLAHRPRATRSGSPRAPPRSPRR